MLAARPHIVREEDAYTRNVETFTLGGNRLRHRPTEECKEYQGEQPSRCGHLTRLHDSTLRTAVRPPGSPFHDRNVLA